LKAAGTLQVTGRGIRNRLMAVAAVVYLLALVLAPAAVAQSTGTIDLELSKSVNPEVAEVGDDVTWTIVVTNAGSGDASGVEVGDILPAGLSYVSHAGSGNFSPADGTWTIGDIAAGATVTLHLVTTLDVIGEIVNEAEVTMSDQEDIDSVPGDGQGDDWDDATVRSIETGSQLIDLELTKSADPASLTVGDETTWTIDLVNQGPDPATGVEVLVDVAAVGGRLQVVRGVARVDAGGAEQDVLEAATLRRRVLDPVAVVVGLDLGRPRVDHADARLDGDCLRHATDLEPHVFLDGRADPDADVRAPRRLEARQAESQFVGPRRKRAEAVLTPFVRRRSLDTHHPLTAQLYGHSREDCARLVRGRTDDVPGRSRLTVERGDPESAQGERHPASERPSCPSIR